MSSQLFSCADVLWLSVCLCLSGNNEWLLALKTLLLMAKKFFPGSG
jgi:hypothetical protein